MIKKSVFIVILLFFPYLLFADQSELFNTRGHAGDGESFINSDFDAYGISVGGILTSLNGCASSVFWNPALLCDIQNSQLQISGAQLAYDKLNSYISYSKPIGANDDKAVGFTLLNSYSGSIAAYDANDNPLSSTSYMGNSFLFTYSDHLSSTFKFGFNAKILNEILDKVKSYGGSLDFGISVQPIPIISIGVLINNIGFYKWENENNVESMGASYKISLGYKDIKDRYMFGLSFSKDYGDDSVNVNFGGEFFLTTFTSIRLGYYNNNFAGGLGLHLGPVDISYTYYNENFLELNNSTQMLALTFNF